MENLYIELLKSELVMAMGCTEPLSLAYAGSLGRHYLNNKPQKVIIQCSSNIIKNVRCVNIPNLPELKGVEASCLLGILGGDHTKGFGCIDNISDEQKKEVHDFIQSNRVTVKHINSNEKLHIILTLINSTENITIEIKEHHLNLCKVIKNDEILFQKESIHTKEVSYDELLLFKNIYYFANNVDLNLIKDIFDAQYKYNYEISEYGLNSAYGVTIGKLILEYDSSLWGKIKAYTAAGSEARMCGCEKAVIINSGSGNQGLSTSVPIIIYGKEKSIPKDKIYRALALANLLTIKQKRNIGALSAYCGIVSSCGSASAGITYLAGGTYNQIVMTMKNYLATVPGIICDGAKASCAAKITVALDGALLAHQLAMHNKYYEDGTGIIKNDIDKTIDIVSEIACKGMKQTDNKIMKFLIDN